MFVSKAKELGSAIYFADQIIQQGLESDLKGSYQKKNIKTVLASVHELKKLEFAISDEQIKSGLLHVVRNTGLMGRWQTLGLDPKIICDTGHNEAGIREVVSQLESLTYNKLHFVLGAVNDKEIDSVLELLPKNAAYYFCQAKIPRALDVNELKNKAKSYRLNGNAYSSVKNAYEEAKKTANKHDLIFIGGSTFVVAEVLQ